MKTNLLKYYIVATYLLSVVVAYGQPGSTSDTGNLEGPEPPPAPIDAYVYVLAAIGAVYVFHRLISFAQQGQSAK